MKRLQAKEGSLKDAAPSLAALLLAGYTLRLLAPQLAALGELSPANFFASRRYWTLLTGFAASPVALFPVLALFFFGSALERAIGSRRFLLFYLWVCLFSSCILVFLGRRLGFAATPVNTAQTGALGCLLGYAVFFAKREILLFGGLPLNARIAAAALAATLALYSLIMALSAPAGGKGAALLFFCGPFAGIVVAGLYIRTVFRVKVLYALQARYFGR